MAQEWNTPEYRAAMEASYESIRRRHPELVTGRFACYVGWHALLSGYFDEVARLLAEHPGSSYSLWQVKEKMAGLRIYAVASPDTVSAGVAAAYRHAEDLSLRTCEVCGRDGVLRRQEFVWMTRCEEHADGGVPVAGSGGKGGLTC